MQKDKFFNNQMDRGLALTYDDVRLKTGYSAVMPDAVDLQTKFSRNIPLKVPIVSAAMDTVTHYKMAIQMAILGGLGVIHKSMSIKEQAAAVARVKLHQHGIIRVPDLITIRSDQTMQSVIDMKKKKGFAFNTFPVVDNHNKLLGVVFGSYFDFCQNNSTLVKDIMATKIKQAPSDVVPTEAYRIMNKHKVKFLPLVDSTGILTGLYTHTDLRRNLSELSTNNVDSNGQLLVAAAVGTGENEKKRVRALVERNVDAIVIDTAHGDSLPVFEMLRYIKQNYHQVDVVVGNISEESSAIDLAAAGADGIKVGQGPGSICTTRIIAGIGCPQVTAIYNCAKALLDSQHYDIPICADGGIKYSGDIPIAIGAGAHSVMLGNLLAGTDESPGEIITFQGIKKKLYRGMGSIGAMLDNPGAAARYHQQNKRIDELVPEGVEGMVPYRGSLSASMTQYIGGLRSGMGYVGAKNIKELQEKADFYLLTAHGQKESHPHDITITNNTINYEVK